MKWLAEYQVTMENTTILSVKGNDGELLIQKSTQKPLIPGNSIAGGLRDRISQSYNRAEVDALFGSIKDINGTGKSQLLISDAVGDIFLQESRTQVKIDPVLGTAQIKEGRGQLATQSYIVPNVVFTWHARLEAETEEALAHFEAMFKCGLKALHQNLLKLGSKKTSGAGAFKLNAVERRQVELGNPKSLMAYIRNLTPYEKMDLTAFEIFESAQHDVFSVNLVSVTPLLIGSEAFYDPQKPDRMHIKNGRGQYIVPGSSIKGVFRNHCAKLAQYFGCEEVISDMFGSENAKDKKAGRVFFNDLVIENVKDAVVGNRIHLDRFTGGVIESAFVEELPIMGSCTLTLVMHALDNAPLSQKAVGLILLTLKDLADGSLSLGSGFAVGRGRFKGEVVLHNQAVALDFIKKDNAYAMKYVEALKG